jgi:hypothetical protein
MVSRHPSLRSISCRATALSESSRALRAFDKSRASFDARSSFWICCRIAARDFIDKCRCNSTRHHSLSTRGKSSRRRSHSGSGKAWQSLSMFFRCSCAANASLFELTASVADDLRLVAAWQLYASYGLINRS